MRAYTLSMLSQLANTGHPIIEKEIVMWVNSKLTAANKNSRLKNFNDPAIADGKIVIDLIDAIKAGSINYDLIKTGGTEEVPHSLSLSLCISLHLLRVLFLVLFRIIWPMRNTQSRWRARSAPEFTPCRRTSLR